jgi:hypothetical protein
MRECVDLNFGAGRQCISVGEDGVGLVVYSRNGEMIAVSPASCASILRFVV